MQSARAGLGAWVFAVVTPFLTAAALLPGEFTHYKRWLELGADETAVRWLEHYLASLTTAGATHDSQPTIRVDRPSPRD